MTTFAPPPVPHDPNAHLGQPPAYIDPDLISLRSAAPSYTSSVPPTYSPSLPAGPIGRSAGATINPRQQYTSLIPPSPIPTHHQFNVASWPSLSNNNQSRAYLNVAARRARRAQEAQEVEGREVVRRALRIVEETDPAPEGSGSASASANGAARLRGGQHQHEDDALRQEQRSWDFFQRQMADWEHREISWRQFRREYDERAGAGKGKKGKRLRWSLYGRFG